MISLTNANQILKSYCLRTEARCIDTLEETALDNEHRMIYCIETADKQRLVCRLSSEAQFSRSIIEQQSRFAMMLYENGIITPIKIMKGNRFCITKKFDTMSYNITLETYLDGENSSNTTFDYFKLGELIGRTHTISASCPIEINYSTVSRSITKGTAKFTRILRLEDEPTLDIDIIRRLEMSHDHLTSNLALIWTLFPQGSVHGDLGIFNNIILTQRGPGIIDFNLAGKEVYLADALGAYYSSIYKSMQRDRKVYDSNYELRNFMSGYLSTYKLNSVEIKYFSAISALFDGLYFCKKIIHKWNKTHNRDVLNQFVEAESKFQVDNHSLSNYV